MTMTDSVKGKVQRILADALGSVEINREGAFVVRHESTVTFVEVFPINETEDADIVVRVVCPMVTAVNMTADVMRWVAIEGQQFHFGSCYVNPDTDSSTGWIYFRYSIVGNDLDPNELIGALYRTVNTANDLDDILKDKFGGKLFSEE